MKIFLIAGQVFAWGKYGGFGVAVRNIARGLQARGIEVCAVAPRQNGQRAGEAQHETLLKPSEAAGYRLSTRQGGRSVES